MSIPKRHSSPENIKSRQRTFFVTTSTDGKRGLLQTERMAMLLIDVMFHYRNQGEYKLHEFVVMRNHFHILITVGQATTVERAVQLIKGGFSYRAQRAGSYESDLATRLQRRSREKPGGVPQFPKLYLQQSVRAGLARTPEEYPYSTANAKFRRTPLKSAAAKAL